MQIYKENIRTIITATLLTLVVASVPLIFNHTFYFEDDWQGFFMPNFLEIARLIKSGHLPLLTDRLWVGGMYLGGYQYAIFHPVSILLYLLIDNINNLSVAASVFTLFHLALLSAATCALALQLNCDKKSSILAGLVVTTMTSVIYWDAKMWIVILVSLAWYMVALSVLVFVYQNRKWFPLAVIASALVFLSGWPQTDLVLVLTAGFSAILVYTYTREKSGPAIIIFSVILGALIASPAILPVAETMKYSFRHIDPTRWQTSIDYFPAIGVPSFMSVWKAFSGPYTSIQNTPILYVSWFIPIVLINTAWKRLWNEYPVFRLLIALNVLLIAITMLPGIWKVRWSFRFLPFAHVFLVLLTCYIISVDKNSLRNWFGKKTILVIGVTFYIAIVYSYKLIYIHLIFLAVVALLITLHNRNQATKQDNITALLTGQVLIFIAMSLIWPVNYLGFSSFRHDLDRNDYQIKNTRRLALYLHANSDVPGFWSDIAPGNRALYHYRESINGYSPLFPKGFREHYCFNFIGAVCPQLIPYLFKIDPLTGQTHLNLLDVDTVITEKGIYTQLFRQYAGEHWQLDHLGKTWSVYTKDNYKNKDIFVPDTLSATKIKSDIGKLIVKLTPLAQNARDNYLVWSRPWYPGWRAYLNGKPVKVERVADILIGVMLPANSKGILKIEYWPRSFTLGLWICMIALLISIMTSWLIVRKGNPDYRPD